MTKTILITGASSGIGLACALQAQKKNINVIATARNQKKLLALKNQCPSVKIIVADIATQQGRHDIIDNIDRPIDYLLHNAALLTSPEPLKSITEDSFRLHIATNVEPIVFLTQKLWIKRQLNTTSDACRILHVSTGAAKQAIKGMSHYCISKAAALMASNILKTELTSHNIVVNDYFPGVVDTAMQETLRSADDTVFPFASTFYDYKSQNQLADPAHIAEDIITVLHDTDETIFYQKPWEFKR